ncbi:hypothetical protein OE88DRAFT_1163594 [Heliocybe sulcata]|uniref:Uncharacterized protein n=1 Tax=Heliocybe sulcata TaxID=5364 RepID=A0A5C3NKR1_9AGAM|nr:hypothetical protein OE88DRAFT_1163594 [Heliocybe sulcata]
MTEATTLTHVRLAVLFSMFPVHVATVVRYGVELSVVYCDTLKKASFKSLLLNKLSRVAVLAVVVGVVAFAGPRNRAVDTLKVTRVGEGVEGGGRSIHRGTHVSRGRRRREVVINARALHNSEYLSTWWKTDGESKTRTRSPSYSRGRVTCRVTYRVGALPYMDTLSSHAYLHIALPFSACQTDFSSESNPALTEK